VFIIVILLHLTAGYQAGAAFKKKSSIYKKEGKEIFHFFLPSPPVLRVQRLRKELKRPYKPSA